MYIPISLDPAGSSMRITHLGILCCIAILLFCASGVLTATGTVKIMPLGDSITKGSVTTAEEADHPTYRYWLWNDLKKNGYDVDFVGSWKMPNFPNVESRPGQRGARRLLERRDPARCRR